MPLGTRPSPNIWHHTSTYEIENRACDPHGRLSAALFDRADWAGGHVLDVGCGTGFHLPFFAAAADRVTGVEPHPHIAALARRRTRPLANVSVIDGTAQAIQLPDASVDVVHARWAYFFGRGCEPGLAELARVVRRGGTALIIDNDGGRSTFGGWFRRGYPDLDPPEAMERFWASQGFARTPVDMGWSFQTRADLEAVVRIEFAPEIADQILAEHVGTQVDYAVNLWTRTF